MRKITVKDLFIMKATYFFLQKLLGYPTETQDIGLHDSFTIYIVLLPYLKTNSGCKNFARHKYLNIYTFFTLHPVEFI